MYSHFDTRFATEILRFNHGLKMAKLPALCCCNRKSLTDVSIQKAMEYFCRKVGCQKLLNRCLKTSVIVASQFVLITTVETETSVLTTKFWNSSPKPPKFLKNFFIPNILNKIICRAVKVRFQQQTLWRHFVTCMPQTVNTLTRQASTCVNKFKRNVIDTYYVDICKYIALLCTLKCGKDIISYLKIYSSQAPLSV